MSNTAPRLPRTEPRAPESPREKPRRVDSSWFAWWMAICLVVLAYSTHQQVSIQRRLLTGSQELERIVAQSRSVSGQTHLQLEQLRTLDAATARLDEKLARIGRINRSIRDELTGLESTAEAILRSVATLDAQTARSQVLLGEVAGESAALHATLIQSMQVGRQLADRLDQVVKAQEAIGADLREMTAKTRFLDRFRRGE